MNAYSLKDKRALITGGSQGIGLGIAQAMAEAGADVVLVARSEDKLRSEAQRLQEETGKSASYITFDLQQTAEIPEWYHSLEKDHGMMDILVNSAAMTVRSSAEDLELEDWNKVINLNLNSVFALCKEFARSRIDANFAGNIINIASLMTAASRPGTAAYTTTKGGIGQMTKALAVDWAKNKIRVNAIGPGYIDTPLNKELFENKKFDEWVKSRCPLGRWGTPEDIGWTAVYLAAPASKFVTGQVLYVDGGWLATF